jgi:uncharacterized membrane protein YqjE
MDEDDKTPATPTGGSIERLFADLTLLIRQEVELAKQELKEKVKTAGIGAGMITTAAITGIMTLVSLMALVAVLLCLVLPAWAAVLIVTALCGATTAVLAIFGKKKIGDAGPFIPEQTIADLKEDAKSARRQR